MGVRYMEFGKLNVALEKLERALDLDDNNANAHNSIAVFYERIRNYSEAEDHFQEALSLSPEDSSVLNNYGRYLCNHGGDTEQGIAYLVKSSEIAFNKRPWFALTNAGQCYFKQGDSQQAEAYFRAALLQNQGYTPALISMAEISYEQAQYMKTRAFLERFLNYHKPTASSLLLGFLAEQALGNDQLAEQYKAQLFTEFPLSEQATKVRLMQDMVPEQKIIPSRMINSSGEAELSETDSESE
jgi:type IV pilus assembly protein PilF